jgi:hypothetical protein
VKKKIDKYYDEYKNGPKNKTLFKNKIGGLLDIAKDELKKRVKKGTEHVNDYISNYLEKKLKTNEFRGGKVDSDTNSEISTEFNYSANLTPEELNMLEEDFKKIIKEINDIDKNINALIDSTNSSNLKHNNKTFYNLIIKRRILLESIKALEMKYNSIKRDIDDRLDNAIDLIRDDKLLRSNGEKKGLKFKLDDTIKEVFNLNLKLGSANDSLNDFIKLIDEKLDLHTTETPYQLGGGLKDYNFYIGDKLQSYTYQIAFYNKDSLIIFLLLNHQDILLFTFWTSIFLILSKICSPTLFM